MTKRLEKTACITRVVNLKPQSNNLPPQRIFILSKKFILSCLILLTILFILSILRIFGGLRERFIWERVAWDRLKTAGYGQRAGDFGMAFEQIRRCLMAGNVPSLRGHGR